MINYAINNNSTLLYVYSIFFYKANSYKIFGFLSISIALYNFILFVTRIKYTSRVT